MRATSTSWKGKPSGLEIPYRVTIDVTSRQVLSLVRDFDEPDADEDLPKRRETFVQYVYVPWFRFLCDWPGSHPR